jgi:hypothetical protein
MWYCVGFEVLSAVAVKSSSFWDITLWSLVKAAGNLEEHIAYIFRVEE